MTGVKTANTWHLLAQIGLIGFLALRFICDIEKYVVLLKHKLALITLSNELHFLFNLIFFHPLAIPLIFTNRAAVSSTIITGLQSFPF